MADHKGFFLYLDQFKPISRLTREQKGELLEAMFVHNAGEPFEFSDPLVEMAFGFFEQTFERDKQRYEDKCAKMRDNAAKKQKQPDANSCDQKQPNAGKSTQQQKQKQEQKQEVKKEEDSLCSSSCPEHPVGGSDPSAAVLEPIISLPLNTGADHPVTQGEIDQWQDLYPAVDVLQSLRSMCGWLMANKQRRKTKSGINRFIQSWLARDQDKGGVAPRASPESEEERAAREGRERRERLKAAARGQVA